MKDLTASEKELAIKVIESQKEIMLMAMRDIKCTDDMLDNYNILKAYGENPNLWMGNSQTCNSVDKILMLNFNWLSKDYKEYPGYRGLASKLKSHCLVCNCEPLIVL